MSMDVWLHNVSEGSLRGVNINLKTYIHLQKLENIYFHTYINGEYFFRENVKKIIQKNLETNTLANKN